MKNLCLLFLVLLSQWNPLQAQTISGTFTQVPCNNDGIYSVTTTGLALPITFTYYFANSSVVHSSINSSSDQLTNIPMSEYGYIYVQASGSNGTTLSYQDSYTPPFQFNITTVNPVCPVTMGTVNANQTSGSSGPFDFSWTNSQTLVTYTGNNVSVPVGDYSGIITDLTTGCVLSLSDTLFNIQQTSNIVGTINTTPANCTNGTATVVASGGVAPYTYLWNTGSTGNTISGLTAGYYSVTITDAQGCSSVASTYVSQAVTINVNTTITNATCLQNDGSALAFGSGGQNPYTYAWANGQTGNNATNLTGQAYYMVVATDANGCIGQGYAYIGATTPINVSYTSTTSQCTSPTGSASLTVNGGAAPYTYLWTVNPTLNNPTISNLSPGSYNFKVTDANGCIRTGSVPISPVSTINATIQSAPALCPSTNGVASVSVSGSNPPFSYSWNNGAITAGITGVSPGYYSCVITDALGCSITKSTSVQSTSPLSLNVTSTPVSCIYANDGTASVTVYGGTAPYLYNFSNGSSSSTATGLSSGQNYVSVSDANGCSVSNQFYVGNSNASASCYCTISGTVYVDANGNCTQDVGENGLNNVMIHCSGYGYKFTDANGNYSFKVPTGSYTISQQINAYYPLAACQNNNINVSVVAASGCVTTVDFANTVASFQDLKIVTMNSITPPIPGMGYNQRLVISNQGTNTESGIQIGYKHDGQLIFNAATLSSFLQLNPTTSPNNYNVQSGFPSLAPGASQVVLLNYSTPASIPLGTNVVMYDTVANLAPIAINWLLDYTPWNNVNTFNTTVIGAYDPNYKEVSPRGTGPQGNVPLSTKEFDYTIHFQNEGTYFAQNIVVTDQLDSDLDWTTFKPGYSDHEYTATVSETGLVTFTFPNINLPWKSNYGDELSSGLVNYSIQRQATATLGTEFTNTAYIYFDFNQPIITNTTVNTLVQDVAGIEENTANMEEGASIDLYPVPVSDNLTIRINNISAENQATIYVIDLMGHVLIEKTVLLETGSTAFETNVSELTTGTYLTRVQFASGKVITKKMVVVTK